MKMPFRTCQSLTNTTVKDELNKLSRSQSHARKCTHGNLSQSRRDFGSLPSWQASDRDGGGVRIGEVSSCSLSICRLIYVSGG
jgi:hypothetical protein